MKENKDKTTKNQKKLVLKKTDIAQLNLVELKSIHAGELGDSVFAPCKTPKPVCRTTEGV